MIRRAMLQCAVVLAFACKPAVLVPSVRFHGLKSATGQQALVELEVANPNRFGLDVARVEYRVAVGESLVAQGKREEPLHIGARDTVVAEFPLTFDYQQLLRCLPAVLNDTLTFRVEGAYVLPALPGKRRLGFAGEKKVSVKAELESFLDKVFGTDN